MSHSIASVRSAHLLEPVQTYRLRAGLVGEGLRHLYDGVLGAGLQVLHYGGRVYLLQDHANLVIKALHRAHVCHT